MAREQQYLKFKLTGKRTPISYELPIASVMLVKKDDNGKSLGKKRIHYIKGQDSMFVEDYKGDEKSKPVFFEDGFLKVHKDDLVLRSIVFGHPWYEKRYELVDEDKKAVSKLESNKLIKKALAKIDISNEFELTAHALSLVGPHVRSWSLPRIKEALEDKAFNSPKDLLNEMNGPSYQAKYIVSLATLREVLTINAGNTAVLWDNGEIMVNVPLGQDPITACATELSRNNEQTRTTLQKIDLAIKRSYTKSYDATANNQVDEMLGNGPANDVPLEDQKLIDARSEYESVIGNVPGNMKNNLEWLTKKIEESK
jgi:hypothetical protein